MYMMMVTMEPGILSVFWLVVSGVLIAAYFIDQHPSAPHVWRSLLRWGKMRVGVVVGTNHFYEVPKRWFQHFYIFAVMANTAVILLLCVRVVLGAEWPPFVTSCLQWLQDPSARTGRGVTNAVPVFLALVLELVQVGRRCYETLFVNVFSPSGTMTVLHYLLGFLFYQSISLCVLAGVDFQNLSLPGDITAQDVITYTVAVVVFLVANWVQHQSFTILAALRSSGKEKGDKVTGTYPLPRGGGFELVSCPHFLAEVMVYFSLALIFSLHNVALTSLWVFVLVNQTLAALLNHQWYLRHFPPQLMGIRRAIFPYLL